MNSEQKKLILVALLLVVAVGLYFYFGREPSTVPDTVKFVCVETGKLYTLNRDDVPSLLPAVNPDTQAKTLIPVYEENGKLYISGRRAGLLSMPDVAKVNKYVDPDTLEVLTSPRP